MKNLARRIARITAEEVKILTDQFIFYKANLLCNWIGDYITTRLQEMKTMKNLEPKNIVLPGNRIMRRTVTIQAGKITLKATPMLMPNTSWG